jgi:hypothetical protein
MQGEMQGEMQEGMRRGAIRAPKIIHSSQHTENIAWSVTLVKFPGFTGLCVPIPRRSTVNQPAVEHLVGIDGLLRGVGLADAGAQGFAVGAAFGFVEQQRADRIGDLRR